VPTIADWADGQTIADGEIRGQGFAGALRERSESKIRRTSARLILGRTPGWPWT
jgi:hypothetical protein